MTKHFFKSLTALAMVATCGWILALQNTSVRAEEPAAGSGAKTTPDPFDVDWTAEAKKAQAEAKEAAAELARKQEEACVMLYVNLAGEEAVAALNKKEFALSPKRAAHKRECDQRSKK